MNKSHFIKGGVLLLMIALSTIPAEAKKPKVFLACETYSIRNYLNEGKFDFVSVMPLMNALGIKGVTLNDI